MYTKVFQPNQPWSALGMCIFALSDCLSLKPNKQGNKLFIQVIFVWY